MQDTTAETFPFTTALLYLDSIYKKNLLSKYFSTLLVHPSYGTHSAHHHPRPKDQACAESCADHSRQSA